MGVLVTISYCVKTRIIIPLSPNNDIYLDQLIKAIWRNIYDLSETNLGFRDIRFINIWYALISSMTFPQSIGCFS